MWDSYSTTTGLQNNKKKFENRQDGWNLMTDITFVKCPFRALYGRPAAVDLKFTVFPWKTKVLLVRDSDSITIALITHQNLFENYLINVDLRGTLRKKKKKWKFHLWSHLNKYTKYKWTSWCGIHILLRQAYRIIKKKSKIDETVET